jgi:hypothetical protein
MNVSPLQALNVLYEVTRRAHVSADEHDQCRKLAVSLQKWIKENSPKPEDKPGEEVESE